ncbi:MAG: penicillin-binding protein 2 [Candidatus Liptonbacteria bacterium]|nr:penicillin-binding protein 2 [Candidatus Liptonbacteria bacterium]
MASRFWTIIAGVTLGYLALVVRLYDLQLVRGEHFLARAQSQYRAAVALDAPRGLIYFTGKDGTRFPVALNKEFPVIYAAPKAIEDAEEAAHTLAGTLPFSADELRAKFSQPNSLYQLLVKRADEAVVQAVEDLNVKGIYADTMPGRYYPNGALGAQVVGFVGPGGGEGERGNYGIEKFYDGELRGTAGTSVNGTFIAPQAGSDAVLTLDPTVQFEAERTLKDLVANYRAQGGTVIVEEPKTGKVLAMASFPAFDPNSYGRFPLENLANPAVQKIYEPGSVLKVITMVSAVDAGAVTPETTYTDRGMLTMNGYTIKNFDYDVRGGHGKVSMEYVLKHSLNTGAVFVEQKLGNAAFLEYLKRFGLAEKTGITLPGELKGSVRPLLERGVRDIAFATASYGQGVAVTPLGLVQAVGAIANGGNLMRPYLDARLEPQVVRRVVSESAAKQVTQMMVAAVDTAAVAGVSGYAIAGKTGTAFVPDFKKGGYTDNVINTYVGFGPATAPRFIILIKLDQPPDAPLAGFSVVPSFQNLAQFLLNYYNIPPDRLEKQ